MPTNLEKPVASTEMLCIPSGGNDDLVRPNRCESESKYRMLVEYQAHNR
jgi:hypothetical protein